MSAVLLQNGTIRDEALARLRDRDAGEVDSKTGREDLRKCLSDKDSLNISRKRGYWSRVRGPSRW